MTTVFEVKLQPKAWAVVQKYGTDATFQTYPSQTQDDNTSTVTPGTSTPFTVKITPPEPYEQKLQGGDDVSTGEDHEQRLVKTLLASGVGEAPIGFTPFIGQRVAFNSRNWVVTRVDPIQSGDNIIAWELVLQE